MRDDLSDEVDKLARQGDLDAALEIALRCTEATPENAQAWNKLAYVQQLRRDFDQALRAIQTAVALDPAHAGLWFERGVIEYRLAQYGVAAETFETCVHVCRESGKDYYLDAARIASGQSYFAARDYQHAADAIDGVNPESATWLEGRLTAARLAGAIAEQRSSALATRARV